MASLIITYMRATSARWPKTCLSPHLFTSRQTRRWQGNVSAPDASIRPNVPAQSPPSTSLQWIPIYDQSPVEFGILDFHGFQPIIVKGAALPFRKKVHFASVFDDVHASDFTVAYRPTPRDVHKELGSVRLEEIRNAKAAETRMDIVLEMDKTLHGSLSAWDTLIRHRVLLEFSARLEGTEKGLI